ncbi:hypothetical protein HDV00_009866 [Rhizophlyctis rosea]|nr:hypothetical protein HDV00_009866 [Rhizophlyctis rosea]
MTQLIDSKTTEWAKSAEQNSSLKTEMETAISEAFPDANESHVKQLAAFMKARFPNTPAPHYKYATVPAKRATTAYRCRVEVLDLSFEPADPFVTKEEAAEDASRLALFFVWSFYNRALPVVPQCSKIAELLIKKENSGHVAEVVQPTIDTSSSQVGWTYMSSYWARLNQFRQKTNAKIDITTNSLPGGWKATISIEEHHFTSRQLHSKSKEAREDAAEVACMSLGIYETKTLSGPPTILSQPPAAAFNQFCTRHHLTPLVDFQSNNQSFTCTMVVDVPTVGKRTYASARAYRNKKEAKGFVAIAALMDLVEVVPGATGKADGELRAALEEVVGGGGVPVEVKREIEGTVRCSGAGGVEEVEGGEQGDDVVASSSQPPSSQPPSSQPAPAAGSSTPPTPTLRVEKPSRSYASEKTQMERDAYFAKRRGEKTKVEEGEVEDGEEGKVAEDGGGMSRAGDKRAAKKRKVEGPSAPLVKVKEEGMLDRRSWSENGRKGSVSSQSGRQGSVTSNPGERRHSRPEAQTQSPSAVPQPQLGMTLGVGGGMTNTVAVNMGMGLNMPIGMNTNAMGQMPMGMNMGMGMNMNPMMGMGMGGFNMMNGMGMMSTPVMNPMGQMPMGMGMMQPGMMGPMMMQPNGMMMGGVGPQGMQQMGMGIGIPGQGGGGGGGGGGMRQHQGTRQNRNQRGKTLGGRGGRGGY